MSGCYSQLTLADRRLLHRLVDQKVTINEMARRLGRHRSTIYREIRRNTFHDRDLPQYTGYFGTIADQLTRERRRRLRKLRRHPDLRADVIRQLKARWSPEQIAGRLLSEGISPVRVSAETIYRFIYSKEDYALGLYQYLPEARRKRRPLRSRKPRDGAFPASHRISQRPDFIGDRSRFGHWEGDLIIFERPFGHANVTSLVERKSRYTVLIKNPSRHSRPIMDKIIRAFSSLPACARQSFTFDRGTEFAAFRALEDGIGARSWFCDPSAPWQKGAVENANKRIRRFLPSNTDLSQMSQATSNQVARILNNQPRKCLGYRTPAEAFMAHLQEEV
ncbi:IS30 family transposase [Agrobacterium tumefaciens]|uniref:IS30 family transposase n=1 Tax=Agrobacterium radiobacter TaxID=362 RepID=A0ABR6JBQ9_AGRRD|nr:IS30 family transposase [Agrobacterium radiobacter]MBB4320718.1 IS30 family transposase [Agrobacterium radiobacter]MBB4337382.1 IS30 family transposase [Agrobacterium radiobacter]MBB4492369.1 IS30 family transposase [Agrobacterium radiobacter]MBB4497268.1 IS30 family transposase [Agrobacterium radiobacter]MBB4502822.1 IS30 family transposase [Agrobacterium radiobacter]